ncbi:MAG: AMP-binding protein, partial [Oscillospiraceae bacterium]|nr:AMP-binding protein [Oscillospiraceae bacterium]
MNILELLEPGGKTSLIQGKRRVTYSELLGGGLRFGARLLGSGADRGKYVLIFLPMSIELYTAMIGAWSVGAVPIFIDFSRGAGFVNSSVDRLKPDIVVCDRATGFMRSLYPMLRTIEMLRIDKDVPAVGAVDNTAESTADSTLESTADAAPHTGSPPAIEALPPEHPAILTFTSGTTGVPKIAVRSHGFLINQYHVLSRHLDYSADHVDLGTLPVFTLASLAARMTTLLPDKRILAGTDAKRLASTMDKERVTRAICSPALMEKLLRHSRLPSLKSVYLGGAPVYPSLLNKIDKNVDIHIVYGSTEAEPIAGIRWDDVSPEDRRGIA